MAQDLHAYQRSQQLAELAAQRGMLLDRVRDLLDADLSPETTVMAIRRLLEAQR